MTPMLHKMVIFKRKVTCAECDNYRRLPVERNLCWVFNQNAMSMVV